MVVTFALPGHLNAGNVVSVNFVSILRQYDVPRMNAK